jgi:hypothetical protein
MRTIGRGYLAAFFPPELQHGFLVLAHDDPGVRAADELRAVWLVCCFGHFAIPLKMDGNFDRRSSNEKRYI